MSTEPGGNEMMNDAIENAIEVLNRVHEEDPSVLPALIAHRVPCNLNVADDPTVQVGPVHGAGAGGPYEVGFLGIVNGLFGTHPDPSTMGFIGAVYDDDRQLVRFERTTPRAAAGLREGTKPNERGG